MEKKNDNISENVRNALTELGNIGAGNAATAMSVMLESKLTISTPQVELYEFNELEEILGFAEDTVVGVLSLIEGDMQSMLLFVLGVEDAEQLVKTLLNQEVDWHSEMGISAIKEVANILIGSYVASLEMLSGLNLRYAVPQICIDMAGSILSVPCIEFGKVSDKALLINSQFKVGQKEINGYIMMVSEVHSFDVLLTKLGIGGIDG